MNIEYLKNFLENYSINLVFDTKFQLQNSTRAIFAIGVVIEQKYVVF